MNNVVLIGRLTRDPELAYTANTQTAVCHFTLAVDRPFSQNREKKADFIRITVFGKQAENCSRYLQKGRQAAVAGRIQTDSYKNKDGMTVNTVDVIANNVEFLGGGSGGNGNSGNSGNYGNAGAGNYAGNNSNDNFGEYGNGSMTGGYEEMDIPDSFQAAEEDLPF